MRKNSRFSLAFLSMLLLGSVVTHAVVVNIDGAANCPAGNAVQVPMTAGAYNVIQIDQTGGGAFTAWNAWGPNNVSGCDGNGANCSQGWLTSYSIVAADVPDDGFGGGIYATPEIAFQNAAENTSFMLPTDQTVSFYIGDSTCGDNAGGDSLDVVPGQVPTMPFTGLILLGITLLVISSWTLTRMQLRP